VQVSVGVKQACGGRTVQKAGVQMRQPRCGNP
jgi:hypothetical protein